MSAPDSSTTSDRSGDLLAGLPLRRPTDPRWSQVALENLDSVLIDHAHCEHKAASMAVRLIGRFPHEQAILRPMLALAREELMHFRQVLDLLEARGVALTRPTPDRYVRRLRQRFCSEGRGVSGLVDLLLVSAFIEARSCERFRLLGEALEADDTATGQRLGRFYRQLADAEGRHWEMFRDLAREVDEPTRVERRLAELSHIEAEVVAELPVEPRMH